MPRHAPLHPRHEALIFWVWPGTPKQAKLLADLDHVCHDPCVDIRPRRLADLDPLAEVEAARGAEAAARAEAEARCAELDAANEVLRADAAVASREREELRAAEAAGDVAAPVRTQLDEVHAELERVREELGKGRAVITAIDSGYQRAISTIIDSNLTTLFAALFLYIFGSGPIKGFAVTLGIGIATSMFTAVMVTRPFIVLWVERKRPTRLVL